MDIDVGRRVGWEQIRAVRSGDATLRIPPDVWRLVGRSRAIVERLARSGRAVYGVTTGFGPLSDVPIAPARARALQRNLILSHALPLGDPLPPPEARLVMYLRIESLARGRSGCTLAMLERLVRMMNVDLLPEIRDGGSVGASGDLAPLALIGAAMMGRGRIWRHGRWVPAARALRQAGLAPYRFREKEALALINGTQLTTALLASAVLQARRLADAADVTAALTIEALRGSAVPFDPRIAKAKPHPGTAVVCRRIRRLLRGSPIQRSHRDCPRVQDAYSLRCVPQVHGAVRDAIEMAATVALREANSAVDNPLVFPDGDILSAGTFHAQHVAWAADALTSALATLGNIVERRIERLTNPQLSNLPAFLAPDPGLHSGLMVLQIAAASLAAENRALSFPASVTTIPTTAAKEDHVSMGPVAVRHLRRVADNVATMLAFEAISAAQALEFLRPLEPAEPLRRVVRAIRQLVAPLKEDRMLGPDVEAVRGLVVAGTLERAAGGEP